MIVEEFGQASADYQVGQRFERDMRRAELTSLPLTIAILIVAFGALVAAGLPVLLAFSAVLAATGLNSLVSHVVPTDAADAQRDHPDDRHGRRDRLLAVLPPAGARGAARAAARRTTRCSHAARTSGQAVLISGATVLIAMAGMFVSGNSLFTTIGLGTMIVVLAAMVGSLTVLPAVLSPAGRQGRLGPDPVLPRRLARRRAVGRASSPASCAGRGRRCSSSAGALLAPGAARLEHAHEAPEPDRPSARPARSCARTTGSSRRSRARRRPAVVVVKAPTRRHAADAARLRPLPAARPRHRASCSRRSPSA